MAFKNTKHPDVFNDVKGILSLPKKQVKNGTNIVRYTRGKDDKILSMIEPLNGKTILGTGGADVVIHDGHSEEAAKDTQAELLQLGRRAWVIEADLDDPSQAEHPIPRIDQFTPLHTLVNSAAIFEPLSKSHSLNSTSNSIFATRRIRIS